MTIRWGIIGCGDVCEIKSGPGFQKAEGSELVAVMRRTGKLAADYAKRHNVPHWYDDADKLIADPEVDAVYVATRPGTHLEYALKVAAAGKPCYVEKPMARSAAECERMITAFEAADLPLFVGYYRRCLPKYVKLKELIKTGIIGEIERVSFTCMERLTPGMSADYLSWRWRADEAGGGLFLDLGCHALDLLDFLVGPALNVRGKASRMGRIADVEDRVSLEWTTESGIKGAARFSFTERDVPEDEFEFVGTKGKLLAPCFQPGPIVIENAKGERELLNIPHPEHVHQPMIQTIVDELRGEGKCPSTATSAMRTSVIMDEVLSDYYGGRDDAFWERPATWPGRAGKS